MAEPGGHSGKGNQKNCFHIIPCPLTITIQKNHNYSRYVICACHLIQPIWYKWNLSHRQHAFKTKNCRSVLSGKAGVTTSSGRQLFRSSLIHTHPFLPPQITLILLYHVRSHSLPRSITFFTTFDHSLFDTCLIQFHLSDILQQILRHWQV